MIRTYTNNIDKDLNQKQVEVKIRKDFLKVLPVVKEFLKDYDGKVFNRRITNNLHKECGIRLGLGYASWDSDLGLLEYFSTERSLHIKEYEVIYSNINSTEIRVALKDNRVDYKETAKNIDKLIEKYNQDISNLEDITTETLKDLQAKRQKLLAQIEEYNKSLNLVGNVLDSYTIR